MLLPLFSLISVAAGCATYFGCGLAQWWWLPLLFIGYLALCVGLWALFVLILSATVDQSQPAGAHQRRWRKLIIETLRMAFPLLRVRLVITGRELLPKDRRFVFTCNHITIYDPMVALVALREHDVTFISKKENMDRRVFGNLMHAAGMLPIDRENDRAAVRTVIQAAKLLKEQTISIGLYPEGYCKRDPQQVLQPFRDGSLKIAQKGGAPVVVSTIRGTDRIMPGFWRNLITDVHLDILDIIPAEEVQAHSTHELGDQIWHIMYEQLTKGADEV